MSIRWRRQDEEDKSDDDDLFVVGFVLEGLKRKQREKKFRGSLPGRENVKRDIGTILLMSLSTMVIISEGGSGCPNCFFCE